MFRGITKINIDGKGRMVIPSCYRERLHENGQTIVVSTIDIEDRCLLIYPLFEWEEIEKKLASLPSFNPVARRIQRLLVGHATDIEMDNQGRILLPPLLREYAELNKLAVLVGQGKKFELWDEANWEASRKQWLEEAGKLENGGLPDEVEAISL